MKKLSLSIILTIFVSIFALFSVPSIKHSVNAINYSEVQIKNSVTSIITSFVEFNYREAGSEQEKSASEYIQNYLDSETSLLPLSNGFVENGVQKFRFLSTLDGEYHNSQNIIYTLPAAVETNKKLILCCSYDSYGYKINSDGTLSLISTEGVNQSAGSVALLLTLAKYCSYESFNFDIEFIFFGAGSSNNAGSEFYTSGISEEDAENILLAINFDTISFGKNLYYYIDEVETQLSKFVALTYNSENIDISEIDLVNLGKVIVADNGKGLTYTHIAQQSNNINFMKANVLTMNLFSGDYETGIALGRCEFEENEESITYTYKDSVEYIAENYGFNVVTGNLCEVYNGVLTLIQKELFPKMCAASFGETNTFYMIFGNQSLVIIASAILLILFLILSLIIHYRLTVKAYNTNIEEDFVAVVLNMSSNINSKTTDEVTKNVSEIVATDIKKDKRIRKK